MPQISTNKQTGDIDRSEETADEKPEVALLPGIKRARRRINERYYDRPEVRRTIAGLILGLFLRKSPK